MDDDSEKEMQVRNMKLLLETASKVVKIFKVHIYFFKALPLMFFLLYLVSSWKKECWNILI